MNDISKQYYKFLSTLQEIFLITNTKEIKVNKIDQGIICFRNQRDNNIEISTAHDVIEHCSNNLKNREPFLYDGVEIQPISKNYNKRYNNENINGISLTYNEGEINFFSFMINCLSEDYNNPKGNEELKKTLNTTQFTLYLEKFITEPEYSRQLYNYINTEDLVQPLIDTMDQIIAFIKKDKIERFSYLNIDRENEIISFRRITNRVINKVITILKSDISAASKNRYNIDYYSSILECLHKDIESRQIDIKQPFTADEFHAKLLSYNKRFDCLVPAKSITSTAKDQKVDKSTKVQKTSIEYSTLPDYTQSDNLSISLSTKRSNFSVTSTTKNQEIDRFINAQVTSTGHILPNYTNRDNLLTNSSTENLIPCKPNSNEQQFTTLLVVAALVLSLILVVFTWACSYCKKRNSNKVETNVRNAELTPLNNASRQSSA